MKKYILIVFPIVLFGCIAKMSKLNKEHYHNADKIIYENLAENIMVEITDKEGIMNIVKILAEAKKSPVKFIPKEKLLFIRGKDTLMIYKNKTVFKCLEGMGCLTDGAEKELRLLLKTK